MATFKCSECGCGESTGASNGQIDQINGVEKLVCSACDPRIGKWHNRFPRKQLAGPYVRDIHGPLGKQYQWT